MLHNIEIGAAVVVWLAAMAALIWGICWILETPPKPRD